MKQPVEYLETIKDELKMPFIFLVFRAKTVGRLVEHIEAQDREIDHLMENVSQLRRENDGMKHDLQIAYHHHYL